MSAKPTNADKAIAAWGNVPDWVQALADACDTHGLNQTAGKINRSPALVSLVIRKKHHASYSHAEERVRNMLMTPIVSCPVLGLISAEQCRAEQAKPFTSVNPLAVAVYRACRECRHAVAKEKNHAA